MTVPQFRAVAWDIDGTLVDSEPLHHRALVAASAAFGTDLRDLPEMAFRGIHMGDVWTLLRPRLPVRLEEQVWLAAINDHYAAGRHGLRAIPGALETIRALHDRGIPQVCVSNSCRAVVDANIDSLGIAAAIRFSISLDDVAEGKPSPLPYRLAAGRLGLSPEQMLAVEDSWTGVRSAKAAGLHTVLLLTGAESREAGLDDDGAPDQTVDDLRLLLPHFDVPDATSVPR